MLQKEITNGRLLKNTGSWMYCADCNKTVGYICYSTFQDFSFDFLCNCGSRGNFRLQYPTDQSVVQTIEPLMLKKNRLCCPNDSAPLFSIVEKHIKEVTYSITCNVCLHQYSGQVK